MLESFVTNYGYPVILLGTFFEGETIMVLGGLVAHLGYLSLGWVILSGMAGCLVGNQLWFFLGRRHGRRLLEERPAWRDRVEKVMQRLEGHHNLVIFGFPFVYGFRIVTPIAIGLSNIPYRRFLVLNVLGVATWACLIGGAGFVFGNALETFLGEVKHYEMMVVSAVVVGGASLWLIHFLRRRQA